MARNRRISSMVCRAHIHRRGLPAIQSALTYLERIASDNLCIDSHNNPSKVDCRMFVGLSGVKQS